LNPKNYRKVVLCQSISEAHANVRIQGRYTTSARNYYREQRTDQEIGNICLSKEFESLFAKKRGFFMPCLAMTGRLSKPLYQTRLHFQGIIRMEHAPAHEVSRNALAHLKTPKGIKA
jgi:hypothetical protein